MFMKQTIKYRSKRTISVGRTNGEKGELVCYRMPTRRLGRRKIEMLDDLQKRRSYALHRVIDMP